MSRQRTANLVKGFAWLSLAAAAMPMFATLDGPSGAATRLTVGLPWSPWLVYRESWLKPETAQAPTLSFETSVEPRSDSMAALVVGVTLLLASRLLKAYGLRDGAKKNRGSAFPLQTSAARR